MLSLENNLFTLIALLRQKTTTNWHVFMEYLLKAYKMNNLIHNERRCICNLYTCG